MNKIKTGLPYPTIAYPGVADIMGRRPTGLVDYPDLLHRASRDEEDGDLSKKSRSIQHKSQDIGSDLAILNVDTASSSCKPLLLK
eukprot:scaffold16330_cov172-Amphora_coffeaeformis.AAC.21